MTTHRWALTMLAVLALALPVRAQERVFSGPQVGEKITPFRVLDVTGPNAGKEVDYVSQFAGAPTVLVFVHDLERSMAPLMSVIDEYGAEQKERLKTLFVFLTADRVASEQRLPLVNRSLRGQTPFVISTDGPEGPGNYGLNKQCLLTIVVAKANAVTANFALVQPGIADAPRVLEAMAKVVGAPNPPDAEALRARRQTRAGGERMTARERPPADLARFNLNSPEGMRDAVRALLAEVQSLRAQVAELRGRAGPARPGAPAAARPMIPGAAPDDPKLIGLLRSFIQPTNDAAAAERIAGEVEAYVKGNADLRRQAVDGWTRVLFLGYGTPEAQRVGQALVERLKRSGTAAP